MILQREREDLEPFNIFVFIFGAIIGSFLNVVIYRVPKAKSIITPRSHCTWLCGVVHETFCDGETFSIEGEQ